MGSIEGKDGEREPRLNKGNKRGRRKMKNRKKSRRKRRRN